MRAAMYYKNSDVRVQELPEPEIGNDEVLMKVHASGICGSDLMEWYRIKTAPRVLGHEVAGEIVQVGNNVKALQVGQRVVVSHHVPCMECKYCKEGHESCCDTLRSTNFDPGGFSEMIRVPEINIKHGVFPIPEGTSYEAASMTEPLACVLRAQRFANMKPGKTVFVIGSGISGVLHMKLARHLGASRIIATDLEPWKVRMAGKWTEASFLSQGEVVEELRSHNDGCLADVVIICAGAPPAVQAGFKSVQRGGTVLLFAPPTPDQEVPLPLFQLWKDEVNVVTSYAGSPENMREALSQISSDQVQVEDMITHRLPLAEIQKGFDMMSNKGGEKCLKVIISPQE